MTRHDEAHVKHRQRMLAAVLLAGIGVFDTLEGLSDVDDDPYVVENPEGLLRLDITGWTWAHVVSSILLAVAGLLLLTGRRWSVRLAALAALASLLIHLIMLPFEPVWSAIVIGMIVAALRLLWLSRRPPARAGEVRSADRLSR
ncbi:DUF7144 family membrane protein [Micromonospora narathiwatensis]|uniref:DUF7144 domain-containing protein n=1 Tax=Micromonospora narathiwatensis TaxID=299146 RepID=A0A1A9AB99_9ACTN|nr:hypothetical protein [Micromonospora narathiwatensis]SBT53421.1 hypothetical protein GA0070621_4789 [Micromonospora narathiwatensis]